MGYAKVLVGVLFLFITLATTSAAFTCTNTTTTNSTCRSLVGYVSPNTTALSSIQSLFQINRFDDLLEANGFNASKQTIQANQTIKIPIACRCANGTGVPDSPPVYTVIKDDVLFHIAAEIFSRLVTYQEIAEFNNIGDANNITVGQQVRIPLPCSCDEVDGVPVVHYAHVVQPGSSVDQIATEFGTTPDILLKLNGIINIQPYQVLDVPLKACKKIPSWKITNSMTTGAKVLQVWKITNSLTTGAKVLQVWKITNSMTTGAKVLQVWKITNSMTTDAKWLDSVPIVPICINKFLKKLIARSM